MGVPLSIPHLLYASVKTGLRGAQVTLKACTLASRVCLVASLLQLQVCKKRGKGNFPGGLVAERASQVALAAKNLPANAGDIRDMGLSSGSRRSPGEGNGNPPQYFSHGPRSLVGYSPQGHRGGHD